MPMKPAALIVHRPATKGGKLPAS